MPTLFHDIETFSLLNLRKVGAWRYAREPSTGIWCMSYAVDDGSIKLWFPGDPLPPEFFEAARDPTWQSSAHNDQFERCLTMHIAGPRYGLPLIPLERRRCSQALALSLALPASLELVAEALDLTQRKDAEGEKLMKVMSKPRKPRKGEPDDRIYWHDDPDSLQRLGKYCIQDTAVERELHQRLEGLVEEERALRLFDTIVNNRGLCVDGELLENAIRVASVAAQARLLEVRDLTAGELKSLSQPKLKDWLGQHGCPVTDLKKGTLKQALRRKDIPADARRIIEMRLDTGAAAAKLFTIRDWLDDDGRVRGCFRFHGGAPGRWTSLGIQIQNLKKPETADLNAAIAAVNSGDLDRVRKLGQPTTLVGDLGRAMIIAAPGKRLFIGDYSGVESRCVAFLADEQSKLDQWAKFDSTQKPEDEPYFLTGQLFGFPAEQARGPGKVGDLAFSFMGSVGAWRRFAPDDPSSDDEIKQRRDAWRDAHPNIRKLWRRLENAAIDALTHPYKIFPAGPHLRFRYDKPFLRLRLPGTRKIVYPYPRLVTDTKSRGTPVVVFKDNAGGKWVDYRHGHGAYGGTWIENATQGMARDLLAQAMLRLESAGYAVVMHVHDEVVCEVDEGFGSLDEFKRLLLEVPAWAAGLPLAAKVRETTRYSAADKPAAPPQEPQQAAATEQAQTAYISEESPEPAISAAHAGGIGGEHGARYDLGDRQRGADRGVGDGDAASDPLHRKNLAGVPLAGGVSPTDGARTHNPPPAGPGIRPQPAPGSGVAPPPRRRPKGPYPTDPHGDRGPKRGTRVATWIYQREDGSNYLKVDKHVLLPSGAKRFYQHHWNGKAWVYGVKGTYAETKIPYKLPELQAALRINPQCEVQLTEGEKDADSLIALGYVATTNPGGALGWTENITAWLRILGVKRIAIHEDNDASGRKRTGKLIEALASFITLRVVSYPDVPDGEDVTWWLQNGHTPEELEARIAEAKPARASGYEAVCVADVIERPTYWLWPGHLLRGSLELLTGYPGLGKSQVQCQYIACATTGRQWPDGSPGLEPCNVIMLTAEDPLDQIIRPRLFVAGAELTRVHVLQRIRKDAKTGRMFILAEDLNELERMIRDVGNVGLVTLDPITAYMGGKLDSHKATDVRFQLGPLAALAERYDIVVSAVTHPAKNAGARALDHYIGSQAFAAAARLGHLCVEEVTENAQGLRQPTKRRLFTQTRNLPIPTRPAIAYRIEGREYEGRTGKILTSIVEWDEEVQITADEALAATIISKKDQGSNIVGFLLDMLVSAPVEVNLIRERGAARQFSVDQLNRAKTKMKLVAFKKTFDGPWFWALPQNAPQNIDPQGEETSP